MSGCFISTSETGGRLAGVAVITTGWGSLCSSVRSGSSALLARPTEVPEIVARRIAEELAVDPDRLAAYGRREPTHREHAGEIQREYGYVILRHVRAG